ncbi:hypothetical protein PANT_4c00017 [Moesziomyces antarcticus T-34]|uniref:Uncharacterized protein n=1 Tax=Pseudozyma antarctica (strain T-34) TaxID=1151754 RepID=M9LJT2_PSEA3|nr:hypothetical protein PANT_4c00017 [Moesziomyces antarcticus T-34]
MPFFNGNVSSEIWIQSSRIGRHVEELKSSVNSSGRPITTIGVAGHRGQRFQLGVSKDLFPNGVTILARENMQSALIRIDLEADIAHTHHVLDPSVGRWYDRQWIVERSAWRFGDIDSLVLAFPPSTTGGGLRGLGHILIYRLAAVDEQEWKVFSSHDQLLQRFSHMTLDTAVTKKQERFTPTTPDTPVTKKREEPIEQPSMVIAPPRLMDPKPFYARRREPAVAPTPKPEHQLQVQQGAQQARPDSQRPVQPALASASDGHPLTAASAARQASPASSDSQHDDVRHIEVTRRPNKVDDDNDDLTVRPETSGPQIAPRKSLAARPVDTHFPSAPSSDHIDDAPIPESVEPSAAGDDGDVESPETPEQRTPSNEAAAAPSIDDQTPMELSCDDEDQRQPTVPTGPKETQERVAQQKTVAERPSDRQATPALSSDEDDDDTPLAPAVERRMDEAIVVDEVGDDEEQPPVARRRRSVPRRTAAARRVDASSPPPFSSDRNDGDDAEYRPSIPEPSIPEPSTPEYISPPRTTVDQPLLNLDALFLEEPPRRSGRLRERQRHQLEKAHRERLEEQERIRKAAPRRPQYPLQAHGHLKALWTRPVHGVMMARTWPMRVANNENVMAKLQDHLECIDDDEERGGRDPEDWRAPEDGVASDLWLHLRQIIGDDTHQHSQHPETGMMEDTDEENTTARPTGLLTQAAPQQRSPERRSPAKAAQKGPRRKSSPAVTIARLVLPNHGNISFAELELQQAWLQTIAGERALETLLDKRRKRWEKVYRTCALHKAYMPFL